MTKLSKFALKQNLNDPVLRSLAHRGKRTMREGKSLMRKKASGKMR